MSDNEITRKIPTIQRKKTHKELLVYEDLQRVADRCDVFGHDIKRAMDAVVEMAGNVRVRAA